MKELVEYLIRSLVENPGGIQLEEREDDDMVTLELRVDTEDLGRVIGKDGSTINAIRTVLQAAAASHKKRARLDVIG